MSESVKFETKDIRLATGGLMRCCTGTVGHIIDTRPDELVAGAIFDCRYEPEGNAQLILDDEGIFRWNHPLT